MTFDCQAAGKYSLLTLFMFAGPLIHCSAPVPSLFPFPCPVWLTIADVDVTIILLIRPDNGPTQQQSFQFRKSCAPLSCDGLCEV
jgi:hypothetical protein